MLNYIQLPMPGLWSGMCSCVLQWKQDRFLHLMKFDCGKISWTGLSYGITALENAAGFNATKITNQYRRLRSRRKFNKRKSFWLNERGLVILHNSVFIKLGWYTKNVAAISAQLWRRIFACLFPNNLALIPSNEYRFIFLTTHRQVLFLPFNPARMMRR